MDNRHGISMPKSNKNIENVTKAELSTKDKVKLLWEEGNTAKEIAGILQTSSRNARKHLNNLGIDPSSRLNRITKYDDAIEVAITKLKVNPFLNIKRLFNNLDRTEKESARRTLYRQVEFLEIQRAKDTILNWEKDLEELLISQDETLRIKFLETRLEEEKQYRESIHKDDRLPVVASTMKRATAFTRIADLYIDLEWVKANHNIDLFKANIDKLSMKVSKSIVDEKLKELEPSLRKIAEDRLKNKGKLLKILNMDTKVS